MTLFAVCLLPLLLPEAVTAWLEYRREAVLAGEVWRLWSGHFVHYSVAHAVLDGLACLILAFALHLAGNGQGVLLRLAVIAPAIALSLLFFVPEMATYRGASGLAMALTAVLWLSIWSVRPGWRPGLILLAVALLLKVVADALGVSFMPSNLPAGISVAWQAHVAGLVSGLYVWHLAARQSKLPGRSSLP